VVATDPDWLARGQELREQVAARRERPAARHEAGAFQGSLAGEPAWVFYRYFRGLERSNLLLGALPRYAPGEWSPLPALRALSDLLLLGLVHHVGRYEPLLPGHGGRRDLRLAPGAVTGESPAMMRLLERLGGAVDPPVNVLLRGEPHTGRELLARSLHLSGPRRDGPFVVATCVGASPAQLDADLFGAEVPGRGAPLERQGKLALADGGTLYLDGVDELPLELQARLVRFLRSGEVEPAGSQRSRQVTVRLIAASHGPLEPRVTQDLFRVDLAHRLSRFAFDVPPLRERREDLPLLIQSYVNRFCHESGKRVQGITVDAMAALVRYDYPGNLQELENLIRRLVYVCPAGAPIRHNLLPEKLRVAGVEAEARAGVGTELRLDRLMAGTERSAIREALRRSRGNKAQAAKLLGLSRNGLAMKMARLGLDRRAARTS
jgi:DNA-binding NtrC family response regulator